MNIGRTANPALNKKTFAPGKFAASYDQTQVMTIQGTVNKTGLLILLVLLGAIFTWQQFYKSFEYGPSNLVTGLMIGGGIGGFILALITVFKRTASPYTAPVYALLEGLFLGGLSAIFESQYPGIVMQAVALTFGTLIMLLLAYKSGWIKATENFKLGVVAATGGIALVYFVSFILSLFGIRFGFLYGNSLFSIGVSVFIVIIAALNLVLDFDFIEHGAESGVPKYMEWYAAFGLIVTLIWLYIEILRLLSKLASRR